MPADFPSRLDLFAIGRDHVVTRATRIDPAQVDVDGTDVNIIVASAAAIAFKVVLQLAQRVNALLLDGASGEDLDRYAFDRYQLTRKGAASALATVTFSRTSFAAGAGTVPIGTRLNTITGIEYIMTTSATFGATDLEASATCRAVQAGKATQVGANTIRRIASPGALFDTTLAVNNEDPSAGGEDAESDDVFRERVRDFFTTARRGTLEAIVFGALSVPGVVSALAIEAIDNDSNPARVVQLYIADSSGVANAALATKVKTALDEYRAGGITVVINTSIPQIVTVVLSLTFNANVDTNTLSEQIRAAVVEYINSLAVNQPLLRADLGAVLSRFKSDGLVVDDGTIVTPVGDLVPTTGRTLRATKTSVTVS